MVPRYRPLIETMAPAIGADVPVSVTRPVSMMLPGGAGDGGVGEGDAVGALGAGGAGVGAVVVLHAAANAIKRTMQARSRFPHPILTARFGIRHP